ncbi:MAG: hypothetical protein AAFX85_04530, partial [Pseudomonadota bacterium]
MHSIVSGCRRLALLLMLGICASAASAQTLLSEIDVVGGVSAPVPLAISVDGAGDFTLTLADQGFPALEAGIEAFDSLDGLLIEASTDNVVGTVSLDLPLSFTATAATDYELIVVGELTAGGLAALFTAEVRDASGPDEFTAFGSLLSPVEALESSTTLIEQITVVNGGSYELRLEDFVFPVQLDALEALLLDGEGNPITRLDLTGDPGPRARTFNLAPGTIE